MQHLFEVYQLLDLALHEPRDGDAGPPSDDLGDVLLVDLLLEDPHLGLERLERVLLLRHLGLELGEPAVAELGRLFEVTGPLGALGVGLGLLDERLRVLDGCDALLLQLPVGVEPVELLTQVGELLLDRLEPSRRSVVRLLGEGVLLDLELAAAAVELVDLLGHRVDLDAQA